ncbi:MFS transporter, partial [Streptomyces spongiae]|uniref:MFS transporter n=1 Tax=Streptomyces spongiae TaxID=565072 RepID=UPI001883C2B8
MPVAMAPIALLMVVRADGGSVRQAGLLAAAYGISAALGQPLWGRMLDRHGLTPTLVGTACASTGAFALLAVLDTVGYPTVAALLALAAGVATPPAEAALRVLWQQVTASDAQLRAALSLDACAQEIVFIVGPLLVLGVDAVTDAQMPLAAAAVLGLAGTVLLATATPTRHWQPAPPRRTDALGPLRAPGPRTLAIALLGAGVALGALNVVALALAEQHHAPALSTLMPAALAVGSLTGGLAYGRLRWPGAPPTHLRTTALGLLAGLLPLLLQPGPSIAVAVAILPGLFLAPLLVSVFSSLDDLAPRGTLGEASAWMVACLGLGQAAGTALASSATGPLPPTAVALAGAAAALTTLLARSASLSPT